MASQAALPIRQGIALRETVVYCNPDASGEPDESDPVDLSDYTARLRVRMKGGEQLLELSTDPGEGLTINGPAGTITILATGTQTAALKSSSGRWDLVVFNPDDGEPDLIAEGPVDLQTTVT